MITFRTWILVADGGRARFLKQEGAGGALRAAMDHDLVAPSQPTRELGTDKPGRTHKSFDGSRHAMEPRVDWHRYEKHLFAKQVAKMVEGGLKRDDFDRLVLVAPPPALGELREALSKAARDKVTGELGKDLTHLSLADLRSHLDDVLPGFD